MTSPWLAIETAPRDRAVLLFSDPEQAVCTFMTSIVDGDCAWIMARGIGEAGEQIAFRFRDATHWMPLPAAPVAA